MLKQKQRLREWMNHRRIIELGSSMVLRHASRREVSRRVENGPSPLASISHGPAASSPFVSQQLRALKGRWSNQPVWLVVKAEPDHGIEREGDREER